MKVTPYVLYPPKKKKKLCLYQDAKKNIFHELKKKTIEKKIKIYAFLYYWQSFSLNLLAILYADFLHIILQE